MTWALFLDDERFPPEHRPCGLPWKIARNHHEVIQLIQEFGMPTFVSFDHDLGDIIPNGDGYLIAKYLCDLDMYTAYKFPDGFNYTVHSQNPVGAGNIRGYMHGYLKYRKST